MFGRKSKQEVPEPRSDGLTDYDVYAMSRQEKIVTAAVAAAALFAVGYIFYQSFILSAVLALFAVKAPKIRTRQNIDKPKKR